jgi:methionine-rich copper-binding protein CopC
MVLGHPQDSQKSSCTGGVYAHSLVEKSLVSDVNVFAEEPRKFVMKFAQSLVVRPKATAFVLVHPTQPLECRQSIFSPRL